MGNDTSRLSGLEIDEKAVELSDFWSHYRATIHDPSSLFNLRGYSSISVFKSGSQTGDSLNTCTTNLMKHRHPHIVRYLWHWKSKGCCYLATEPVQPLSQLLSAQDSLQICVGLHHIALALDFLHTQAQHSHNNVGVSSIYVMPDGSWRLGGMEFLKSFAQINASYLKQIKKHRYDLAIDPHEETADTFKNIDQYAFGTLVEDVFKGRSDEDVPHLSKFRQYCKKELKNPSSSLRPSFAQVLQHDFFNHEFISVHKFLSCLPIKSESEKSSFFATLLPKLETFQEETVARQLAGSLLSRLVLLNSTARDKLIPHILTPKSLFSLGVFKNYITPQLLKMFRVRDTQVRLLLLKYFSDYMPTFSEQELTAHILPELLLGIKDTDDSLVSMTLYCLADLIPILGASTVIGAKRCKIFTDGRPMIHTKLDSMTADKCRKKGNGECLNKDSTLPIALDTSRGPSFGSQESIEIKNNPCLHERPSPDGGEDLKNSEPIIVKNEEESDDENWSDWEDNKQMETEIKSQDRQFLQNAAFLAKSKKIADISELDIKNQKSNESSAGRKSEEFDFFTDMEPVIQKANTLLVDRVEKTVNLNLVIEDNDVTQIEGSAWGDVNWDED